MRLYACLPEPGPCSCTTPLWRKIIRANLWNASGTLPGDLIRKQKTYRAALDGQPLAAVPHMKLAAGIGENRRRLASCCTIVFGRARDRLSRRHSGQEPQAHKSGEGALSRRRVHQEGCD